MYDIKNEIVKLKKEKNILLLAHYYESGDIQDIADFVGDSYFLAKKGQESEIPNVLLAGVVFMAESVKILSPHKKVFVPDLNAGCSLVDEAPYESYLLWRKNNPEAIAVTYINSSAQVKAISDVIVTSSNAQKIVEAIPQDRKILFGPDQHLGKYLSKKLNRKMEFWPGSCQVHVLFNAKRLVEIMSQNPDAVVIAHPECDESVLKFAHVIGSTSRLLEEVKTNPSKKFIVATETGIFHQMLKMRPDVTLIQAPVLDKNCACNDCPYMKLNTLEKIYNAMVQLKPEVEVLDKTLEAAQISLNRMMALSEGGHVNWPKKFEPSI